MKALVTLLVVLVSLVLPGTASAFTAIGAGTGTGGFDVSSGNVTGVLDLVGPEKRRGIVHEYGEAASGSSNAARAAGAGELLVIGRGADLAKPGALQAGERALSWLSKMPNAAAEWKINSGLLRQEMQRGLPIRDLSPGNSGGMFLNAERNLLQNHGWTFDASTNLWLPPVP